MVACFLYTHIQLRHWLGIICNSSQVTWRRLKITTRLATASLGTRYTLLGGYLWLQTGHNRGVFTLRWGNSSSQWSSHHPKTSSWKYLTNSKHAGSRPKTGAYVTAPSPFSEQGGTWGEFKTRQGGGRGGSWVFGKGFMVFRFSSPTGAAYLLGVVLMHCVGYSGRGSAASAASETDHLECAGWTSGNAIERH